MNRCLIYLDGQKQRESIDLLEAARQIFADEAYEATAAALISDPESLSGIFDKVVSIRHAAIQTYDPAAVTQALFELQQKFNYDCILIPATPFGRMLAPRLAMRLHAGLVADVTAISRSGAKLNVIRPAYSGRIMAAIAYNGSGPVMLSIRQGIFRNEQPADKATQFETFSPAGVQDSGLRRLDAKAKVQAYDIRESKVLISGGAGVTGNFHQLDELAQRLNGQVSASRKIVDLGIAPRSIQVGQSGKTVSPKLYIALGIYGAIQHVEGLKQVESIISVNVNKDAPINSLADIVVVGDAVTFIEKLSARIDKSNEHGGNLA